MSTPSAMDAPIARHLAAASRPGRRWRRFTWFRVGGPAEVAGAAGGCRRTWWRCWPACRPAMPLTVLGAGSNLIIRDGGVPGVVLRLGGAFAAVQVEADGIVAGAAALDVTVAQHAAATRACRASNSSPASPAASAARCAMNAGAYGGRGEGCARLGRGGDRRRACRRLARRRPRLRLSPRRRCRRAPSSSAPASCAAPGDAAAIAARMAEIRAAREATQPVRARTGGSTFKNPPRPQGLGADRRRRLPRPDARRRAGVARSTATSCSTPAAPPRPSWKRWARRCAPACWRTAASRWTGKSSASGVPAA